MSTIAVFIALGGTSYAVARNSIGTPQLKSNAVTSAKVKDGALRRSDLAPSARTGQRGPRGPQGPAGSNGVSASDIAPEAWKALEYAGTWGNYPSVGIETGAYRKDKMGLVHLRGTVSQLAGIPVRADVIAVLPEGYRPQRNQIFETASQGDVPGQITIGPDGRIVWVAGAATDADFVTLNGVTFFTD